MGSLTTTDEPEATSSPQHVHLWRATVWGSRKAHVRDANTSPSVLNGGLAPVRVF